MEEGLYTYLASQTTVTDIVGTQIYQGNAPQGVDAPYLVATLIAVEEYTHSAAGSGLAKTTIQVDCYENTYADAKALAAAVRGELHTFNNGTMGSVFVRSCLLTSQRDLVEQPTDASEVPVYGVSHDYEFMHPVSVPSFS